MYYIIVIVEKLCIVVRRNMCCFENELLKFLYLLLVQQINNLYIYQPVLYTFRRTSQL